MYKYSVLPLDMYKEKYTLSIHDEEKYTVFIHDEEKYTVFIHDEE